MSSATVFCIFTELNVGVFKIEVILHGSNQSPEGVTNFLNW